MLRECAWIVVFVAAGCLPAAQAGGSVEATVDGGRGPCGPEALVDRAGACVLDQEGNGMDVAQRNLSANVVVRDEFWSDLGVSPPAREDARIEGSNVTAPNPAFGAIEAVLDGRAADHPLAGWFGANLTPEMYDYWYYGPSVAEPGPGLATRYGHVTFGEDWVGHDRLGPFDDVGGSSTEAVLDQYEAFACSMSGAPDCEVHADRARDVGASWTPDITFGLDLGHAAIDPSGNSSWGTSGDRSTAFSLPDRSTTPPPPVLLPLRPEGQGLPVLPPDGPVPDRSIPALPNVGSPPTRAEGNAVLVAPAGTDGLPRWVAATTAGVLLVLAALYARIHRREEALRSRRRLELVELLKVQGPMSIASLARTLGVDRTTIEHHARVLERTGEVRSQREGRMIYVFLPGQAVDHLPGAPRPTEALLLRTLEDSGGVLDRNALAERIPEVTARTRNHALNQLLKRGAIRVEFDGYAQRIIRV